MERVRQQKVASSIQRIVAMVILREVADPRVDGLVSVTRVDVTPDLREAKVWISILGGTHTDATTLAGIQSAGRRIQDAVAEQLPMRFMPRLSFHIDETLKKQAEILKKINETMAADAAEKSVAPTDDHVAADKESDDA